MPYSKQTWVDGKAGGTPVSAARLGVIEQGIETAQATAEAKASTAYADAGDAIVRAYVDSKIGFPLGCAENPVTDPNAVRPTGIPVVWWRTPTIPTAAAVDDVVELPDTAVTAPSYLETFDATTGSWVATTNASAITRDTGVGGGSPSANTASLRWTATAAGNSSIRSPFITGLTPGQSYVCTGQIRISGTGTKSCPITVDFYNNGGATYLNGFYDYSVSVAAGASGFVYFSFAFTPIATTTHVTVSVQVAAAALGQQAWIDNVRVLG